MVSIISSWRKLTTKQHQYLGGDPIGTVVLSGSIDFSSFQDTFVLAKGLAFTKEKYALKKENAVERVSYS